MTWNDKPLYEPKNRNKGNTVDTSENRQHLKWGHEVMIEKDREPRAAQESPLKIWWEEQQRLKDEGQ